MRSGKLEACLEECAWREGEGGCSGGTETEMGERPHTMGLEAEEEWSYCRRGGEAAPASPGAARMQEALDAQWWK